MTPKILIHSNGEGSLNHINNGQNVQGDQLVARAWRKYIERRSDLKLVHDTSQADYIIYFDLFSDTFPGKHKNINYLQNVYPSHAWAGGTVGQFNLHKHKFDHFIFTSNRLKENCKTDGAVIPFATDPEIFFRYDPVTHYRHPISFVGNGIRTQEENNRYIMPVIDLIAIYGNIDGWAKEYHSACKGKLPLEDEPILYSSSLVNLNFHISEHLEHDTPNFRIYNILACGGVIITDRSDTLVSKYSDFVSFTDGGEDLKKQMDWLRNVDILIEADTRATAGQRYVLEHDTFEHRVAVLAEFIRGL